MPGPPGHRKDKGRAALITEAKPRNKANVHTVEWMHTSWFIHKMEFYTVVKMKRVRTGANPTDVMLGAMWFHTTWFHCIKSGNREN